MPDPQIVPRCFQNYLPNHTATPGAFALSILGIPSQPSYTPAQMPRSCHRPGQRQYSHLISQSPPRAQAGPHRAHTRPHRAHTRAHTRPRSHTRPHRAHTRAHTRPHKGPHKAAQGTTQGHTAHTAAQGHTRLAVDHDYKTLQITDRGPRAVTRAHTRADGPTQGHTGPTQGHTRAHTKPYWAYAVPYACLCSN